MKMEEIFRQEGWHYQLEQVDDPLKYNGVVYNEMKGAFSSSEEVLEREIFNVLFPDTPYGVESGGDPKCIPDLTYENFLAFHGKYYHPSNSYIFLYGNMDMAERLEWMDKEYLSKFDKITVDSQIAKQKPFEKPVEHKIFYPVGENDSEEENTYLTYSMVVGDGLDVKRCTAFEVLDYVLLSAPGAPLRQALLDAGIGKDVDGGYNDGIYQPFFTVEVKSAEEKDKEKFLQVIRETLGKAGKRTACRRICIRYAGSNCVQSNMAGGRGICMYDRYTCGDSKETSDYKDCTDSCGKCSDLQPL